MRELGKSNAGSRRSSGHGNLRFRWPEMAESGCDAMDMELVKQ